MTTFSVLMWWQDCQTNISGNVPILIKISCKYFVMFSSKIIFFYYINFLCNLFGCKRPKCVYGFTFLYSVKVDVSSTAAQGQCCELSYSVGLKHAVYSVFSCSKYLLLFPPMLSTCICCGTALCPQLGDVDKLMCPSTAFQFSNNWFSVTLL